VFFPKNIPTQVEKAAFESATFSVRVGIDAEQR